MYAPGCVMHLRALRPLIYSWWIVHVLFSTPDVKTVVKDGIGFSVSAVRVICGQTFSRIDVWCVVGRSVGTSSMLCISHFEDCCDAHNLVLPISDILIRQEGHL